MEEHEQDQPQEEQPEIPEDIKDVISGMLSSILGGSGIAAIAMAVPKESNLLEGEDLPTDPDGNLIISDALREKVTQFSAILDLYQEKLDEMKVHAERGEIQALGADLGRMSDHMMSSLEVTQNLYVMDHEAGHDSEKFQKAHDEMRARWEAKRAAGGNGGSETPEE